MKKDLFRILGGIIVLLTIIVSIDVLVGFGGNCLLKWLNKTHHDSDAALRNYDLNAAMPDVAIIGSSTAICHYDPVIIHDSLKKFSGKDYDVFNMGMSRQRLAYENCALEGLVQRKVPKMVIMDVWASYCSEGSQDIMYNEFRPYIKMNNNVRDLMERHGELNALTRSNLFCYNTEIIKLLLSITRSTKTDGFQRDNRELQHAAVKIIESDTASLAQISVNEFNSIIELARSNDIKLFFVLSPRLSPSDTNSLSYKYMKETCEDHDVPFLDFSNDEKYFFPHYFRDNTHMNRFGAAVFTQDLMNQIKSMIVDME